jgi:tetratricopeptide (TPR) repeat protein
MIMRKILAAVTVAGIWTVVVAGATTIGGQPAHAMGESPDEPKIDCRKKKNKKKKECKKKQKSGLSDEERYRAGYWLAKSGKYEEALVQFRKISNQNDPRVLNYIGFATRKLGRVGEAMGYYRKVLRIDPNYTLARAYMAEALLTQGKVDAADQQLGEIGLRCGRQCEEYVVLARQIDSFKASGRFDPQGGKVLRERAKN